MCTPGRGHLRILPARIHTCFMSIIGWFMPVQIYWEGDFLFSAFSTEHVSFYNKPMHSMSTEIFKAIFYNRLLVIDKCYKLNLEFRNKVFVGVVGVQLSISLLCLFAFKKILIQKKSSNSSPKSKIYKSCPRISLPFSCPAVISLCAIPLSPSFFSCLRFS